MAKKPFDIVDSLIFAKGGALEAQYAKAIPDTIYHYTNTAGFLGILQNRALWASRAEFLNDAREFRYGLDIAYRELDLLGKSDSQYTEFLKALKTSMNLTTDSPFIVCFCKDGDLLSQWRGYSSHGQGLSIGFKSAELLKIEKIFLNSLIYDQSSQAQLMSETIKGMADAFLTVGIDLSDPDAIREVNAHSGRIERYCGLLKDAAFREECELRLSVPDFRVFANNIPVKFRIRNNLILQYIEIDLSSDWSNIIEQVIIGPGPEPDLRMASISQFLERIGLGSVSVKLSSGWNLTLGAHV